MKISVVISIILFSSFVFLLGLHNIIDIGQDLGLHFQLGKIIWQTHIIPTTNFFSFTAPDFQWFNDTWISKVIMYLTFSSSGFKGLIILKAITLTLAFFLSFFAFYRKELTKLSILIGLISVFILIERTDIRPEIFSWVFLSYFIFTLFRENKLLIRTLPVIQLLWVNTHIYFFLGPAIYLAFLVGNFIKSRKFNKELIFIGFLVFFINIINPLWFKGALYPFHIYDNYAANVIENSSPFHLLKLGLPPFTTYFLFAGIILSFLTFILNRKNFKNNFFSFGLFIISATLSLLMLRNYPIFALVMLPVSIKNIYESNICKSKNIRPGLLLVTILVIFNLSIITDSFYKYTGISRNFGFHVSAGPQAAVDFIKTNKIKGPIFNNTGIGSFLIWKLPEEKVFIDTRTEAYPGDFFNEVYFPMITNPESWEFYSEKYNINMIIIHPEPFDLATRDFVLNNIAKNSKWQAVYIDVWAIIFVRKAPANAEIIRKYGLQI